MPLERVKQEFKDISMSFETNPLNDDLIALKNTTAIARSIRNIVFSRPGEKFFEPNFGSKITESLFENIDEVSALAIRDEIDFSIREFEPRVEVERVRVTPDFENNEMNATIVYRIVGIYIPPQQLDFVLLPTR